MFAEAIEAVPSTSSAAALNAGIAAERGWLLHRPVLDPKMKIVGYEFIHAAPEAAGGREASPQREEQRRLAALEDLSDNWVFGDQLIFTDAAIAANARARPLLAERQMTLCCRADAAGMESARQLHADGFTIVIDGKGAAIDNCLLPAFAGYVRFHCGELPAQMIDTLVGAYRNNAFCRLIASVDAEEEFRHCAELGVQYFQGDWFTRPGRKSGKGKVQPIPVRVFEILDLVRNHADVRQIEQALKHDVGLSVKLLRYINSAAFGLTREIQSFRHAVTVLGYEKLQRWLMLLLVTHREQDGCPALMHTAIVRGRFAELLGKGRVGREDLDNLFMVGVFSLLEALLEAPLEESVRELRLPAQVSDALLARKGVYAPFLALAEACDTSDFARIGALAQSLKVTPGEVNLARLEALSWANLLGI